MRTTIRIDDALYRRAKSRAAEQGRTVSEVIEDAVRSGLEPKQTTAPDAATRLPTFRGTGTLPGIDLNDNARLRDVTDEGEPLRALR
jgi:hypothetical protein